MYTRVTAFLLKDVGLTEPKIIETRCSMQTKAAMKA